MLQFLTECLFLVYRRKSNHPDQEQQKEPDNIDRTHQTLKLTDQYLALLLVTLTNAGLCDVRSRSSLLADVLIFYIRP